MSNIIPFQYDNSEVRIISINNEPWFVAKDVCEILEVQNVTQALDRLDADERSMFNIGRQGDTNIVSESGLYTLVLGSRKPEAKQFKRWITREVIPTIRKTGGYVNDSTQFVDFYFPQLRGDQKSVLHTMLEETRRMGAKIQEDAPKVLFADSVAASHTSILIGDLAKLIRQNGKDIGQNRLFDWLRRNGFLCGSGDRYNSPTQKAMDLGLFEVKERTVGNPDGTVRITRTTTVTGKGQQYFINKFLGGQAV